MTNYSLRGVVRITWHLNSGIQSGPIISFESVKICTTNFVCWFILRST